MPPAVEALSPNHWTAREVPKDVYLQRHFQKCGLEHGV